MRESRPSSLWLILTAVAWAGRAAAVDGVIEINIPIAVKGGINGSLTDDPPGYPVRITSSGSYRLTGNLATISATGDLIEIGAQGVEVDLNGFSLIGANTCGGGFGTSVTCTANGTGRGVFSSFDGVVVRNGTIRGMGGSGVVLDGLNSRVEHVFAKSNGERGISLGFTGSVSDSHAFLNRTQGIQAQDSAQVRGCTTERNGGTGIQTGPNSSVSGSVANGNEGSGITCSGACSISANTVTANGLEATVALPAAGIQGFSGSTISNNTITGNFRGITADYSLLLGNTIRNNLDCGVNVSVNSLGENVAADNGTGPTCQGKQLNGLAIGCNWIFCGFARVHWCQPDSAPPTCP